MIRLVHARSGGDIWVHESRLDEYLAAGHRLAAAPIFPPPKEREKKSKKTKR